MKSNRPSPLATLLMLSSVMASVPPPPPTQRKSAPGAKGKECDHCGEIHDDELPDLTALLDQLEALAPKRKSSRKQLPDEHKFLAIHGEMFAQLIAMLTDHGAMTIDEILEKAEGTPTDPVGKYIIFMLDGGIEHGWIDHGTTVDGSNLSVYKPSAKFGEFVDEHDPSSN